MADQITAELIVKAIAEGFDKVAAATKEIGDETKKTGDKSKSATDKAKMGWTAFNQALEVAKKVFNAVKQAAEIAYQVISEGSQLEAARRGFENITSTIGTTSDAMLGQLRTATKGMVSDQDLIAASTQAMALNIGETSEEIARATSLAVQLGIVFRGDAAAGVGEFNQTIVNMSWRRLDQLGISAQAVRVTMNELQTAQSDLTDEQAFFQAVLIEGERSLDRLGDAAETSAGKLAMVETAWQNSSDQFKEGAAQGVVPLLDDLNELNRAFGGTGDAAQSFGSGLALGLTAELRDAIKWMSAFGEVLRTGGDEMNQWSSYIPLVGLLRFNRLMNEARYGVSEMTAGITSSGRELKTTSENIDETTVAQESLNSATLRSIGITEHARGGMFLLGQENVRAYNAIWETEQATRAAEQAELDKAKADEIAAAAAARAAERQNRVTRMMTEQARAAREALRESGRYFVQAEEDLSIFEQSLEELGRTTVVVGGRTQQQNQDLEALRGAYSKAADTIRDYELGIKGANLTDEERNEKIQEQRDLMAQLETRMGPLLAITGEVISATHNFNINQDAANALLVDAAEAAGADAMTLALLKVATGELTVEQARAILIQAALTQKAAELGEAIANGSMSIGDAQQAFADFQDELMDFTTDEAKAQINNLEAAARSASGVYRIHFEVTQSGGQIVRNTDDPNGPALTEFDNQAMGGPFRAGNPILVGHGPSGRIIPGVTELMVPSVSGMTVPGNTLETAMRTLGANGGRSSTLGIGGPAGNISVGPFIINAARMDSRELASEVTRRIGESARG